MLYTLTHLGIDPNLPGDKIYNGANDNATCAIYWSLRASGLNANSTAAVDLFASVTAEEQGRSVRILKHLTIPPGKISVDLNFDDVPPLGNS